MHMLDGGHESCRLIARPLSLRALLVGSILLAGCTAPPSAVDSSGRSAPAAPPRASVPNVSSGVSLEALVDAPPSQAVPPLETGRNPFRFEVTGPSERRDARAPADLAASIAAARRADAAAQPPRLTPTLRAGGLRFIGVVETRDRGRRVAVLTDGDGVYHGQVNDILRGRYRLAAIGDTSVEIEDLPRRTRATLRLGVGPVVASADE